MIVAPNLRSPPDLTMFRFLPPQTCPESIFCYAYFKFSDINDI